MFIPIVFHLWSLYIIIPTSTGTQQQLQSRSFDIIIGGVFTDRDEGSYSQSMESIFKYAIFHYNRLAQDTHNLSYRIRLQEETLGFIAAESAVQAVQDVCTLVNQRPVQGIFGAPYPTIATLIHSICYHVNIPLINVCSSCYGIDILAGDDDEDMIPISKHPRMAINLYPSNDDLNIAFHNLTNKLEWTKFLIIYDIDSGLTRLQKLLSDPGSVRIDILVRQFTHEKDRSALLDALGREIYNIILDLNDINTYAVLKMALQMGMISPNYHYVLTTLNIDAHDLEDFKYNYVNLTAFRLFNHNDARAKAAMESFFEFKTVPYNQRNPRLFTTSVALWADAILAFAYAYDKLVTSYVNLGIEVTRPTVSCADEDVWQIGSELYSRFSQISFEGITGKVKFTSNGERTGFELDVVHLSEAGLIKIGKWSRELGANFTHTSKSRGGLFNSTLTVTTILEAPYVMFKNNENLTRVLNSSYANTDFEGFCVDLLEELSRELNFVYKIKPITTGRYDDMVDEVKNKVADFAIAPLTINYAREKKIDFTKPFLSLGIGILFKSPKPEKPGLFSFLSPLSLEIWMYTFAAVFTVSFILLLIARCSPDEWRNPYPCDIEYDYLENRFTVSNTLWFSIGTLMQQGSDVSPSAISTRLISGIWWFFTLILISSYTANLAAFLTVEKVVNPIESAEGLAKQTKIKYGLVSGGSTEQFFRESSISTYQTMWKYMVNNPDVFVKSNQEGIERVQNESYAFLMESTSIDYTVQRDCHLTQIGGLLDNKGYGIGLPEGSPHRERFSEIILDLQERGIIQKSYDKWWKGKGKCTSDKKDSKAYPLGIRNVGGIFVVLFGGVILSLLVAVVEFLCHARKNHANRRHSIWWELIKEIRFAVQCGASNRKALSTRRCSQCKSDQNSTERSSTHYFHHRSSSASTNSATNSKPIKLRTSLELPSDADKFDSLLMLATEQTNNCYTRGKRQSRSSVVSQRKSAPLLLVEQQTSNHVQGIRPQNARLLKNTDSFRKQDLRPRYERDDHGDSNDDNSLPLSSHSSINSRLPYRTSRL